jgi:hypothetical protein
MAVGAGGKTIIAGQSKDYIINQPLVFQPDIVNINLNQATLNFSQSGGSLTCITMELGGGGGIQAIMKVALQNGILVGSNGGTPVNANETMIALHASVLTIENVYI